MNGIAFAGTGSSPVEQPNKRFEVIVAATSGEILSGGARLYYGAGDIIVVPPYCKFTADFGEDDIRVSLERALLPFEEPMILIDDTAGGVKFAAQQAAWYFHSGLKKSDAVLSALGGLIVGYITAFTAEREFSPAVERIRTDIERNLSDPTFSLEDYLKKLPLNYDYVRKLFKKEVGVTPHGYLLSGRMELAASLLSGGLKNKFSNYSVSQVAEACGFSEPLYFSRVFKKYYGVAPSGYCK